MINYKLKSPRDTATSLIVEEMATLRVQSVAFSSLSSSASSFSRRKFSSTLQAPSNVIAKGVSLPALQKKINVEKISMGDQNSAVTNLTQPNSMSQSSKDEHLVLSKFYAILEAVADRAEMHAIIGQQRDNWNHLLTNSINSITLTASLMAGISSIPAGEATSHVLAFKLSSMLLFTAATGMMAIVNKIQPSQLAEEQRNATRLS